MIDAHVVETTRIDANDAMIQETKHQTSLIQSSEASLQRAITARGEERRPSRTAAASAMAPVATTNNTTTTTSTDTSTQDVEIERENSDWDALGECFEIAASQGSYSALTCLAAEMQAPRLELSSRVCFPTDKLQSIHRSN